MGCNMDTSEIYLKAILATVARQTFPVSQLLSIVAPNKNSKKNFDAYNSCDGILTQGEIAKKFKLDHSNFSKTISKWSEHGIIIKVLEGSETRPVHVYPIPDSEYKKVYGK